MVVKNRHHFRFPGRFGCPHRLRVPPAVVVAALLRATGADLRAIADQLNRSSYCTPRGKAFHPMGVQRLLASSASALLTGAPA